MAFGFPLNLSIASWQISLNHSSSGSTLTKKKKKNEISAPEKPSVLI
jgi:hypothetical protein